MAYVVWANGNGQHNMSEHITPSSSAASQEYLAGMQKLAEDIVRAQQPEIDQMQAWLKEQKKH